MNQGIFDIMFIVVPIIVFIIFAVVFAMILSPKLRGKFLARQFKSTKYMLEESADELKELSELSARIGIESQGNILNKYEDELTDISRRKGIIEKENIKGKVSGIKEGLTSTIYCKHCGEVIDADSKFCKKCGKEQ